MTNVDYSNRTIWGIHAGKTGDADSLFLKKSKVAFGWRVLINLVLTHYELFDYRCKGLLLFKRVFAHSSLKED